MSSIDVPLKQVGFGQTARKDTWWREPLLVFLGFSAFIVYSTWAALQGDHYTFGPVSFPDVFAASHDRQAVVAAVVPAVLGGDADPVGAAGIPLHLLLLSRRVLQSVLGRPAVLHRGRAAQDLLGREEVPADHSAKRAPLLSVLRDPLHLHPGL